MSFPARAFVRYAPYTAKKLVQYAPKIARGISTAKKVYAGYKVAQNAYQVGKKIFPKKKIAPVAIPKKALIKRKYRYGGNTTRGSTIKAKKTPTLYNKTMNQRGSVAVNEYGGIYTCNSTEAMYVSHGVASEEVMRSTFRAILKELMHQRKTDILNWDDGLELGNSASVTDSIFFNIRYANDPSSNSNTYSTVTYTPPTTGITYTELADALMNQFRNLGGAGDQPKELIEIHVYQNVRNSANTTTVTIQVAKINFNQAKFDYKISSKLTIQNRTLAEVSSVAEPVADRDSSDDIENVPLIGKIYSNQPKWANYINTNMKSLASDTSNDFTKKLVCDGKTGIMFFESATSGGQALRKPPPGWVLGFKSHKNFTIQPGTTLENNFTFSTQLSTQTVFQKFSFLMGNASSNNTAINARVDFGRVNCIGLEKYLDTFRSSGTLVSLGFQLSQTYSCSLVYKKRLTSNPIVNSTQTSISATTDRPS